MNSRDKRFKLKCHSVLEVVLVAVYTLHLSSMVLSKGNVNSVVYAYSNNQAQSLVNECGQDESSGINCVANGPQGVVATSSYPVRLDGKLILQKPIKLYG